MTVWIWVALIALFIIIEAATVQLVTIWFAIGSLAALITAFFTDSIFIQLTVFVVVSVIVLAITRPVVKKITNTQKHPTNADMYIGKEAIVTEPINNIEATGLVKVGGSVWTARTESDGCIVHSGEHVTIIKIEGVKLIVRPIL